MYTSKRTYFNLFFLLSTVLLLVVFLLRLFYNTSFITPLQILTSGYEDESLFAIWKYVHGMDVYTDFHKIPYAASYFNWGFYVFYGSITKLTLALFNAGDEWIPQIGRIITLAGCLTGFIYAVKIAKYLIKPAKLSILLISLPLCFFGGYFMGFWAITVRPDVWALAFELIGLYYFVCYVNEKKVSHVFLAVLFFYTAFSFKQNFIGIIGGCIVFLVLKNKWKAAISISLVFAGMLIGNYLLGSSEFQYLLVKSQAKMSLEPSIGIANLKLGFFKCLPITLFAIAMALFIFYKYKFQSVIRIVRRENNILLLLSCFVISFFLFFAMSMKGGASDNYFFTPFIVLALLLVLIIIRLQKQYLTPVSSIYAFVCLLSIIEGVLILKGQYGQMNVNYLSQKYGAIKSISKNLPTPLYVENDNYANLPWINRSKENFVLATTYYYKDLFGEKFENDGIEGLMQNGYFNSIININSKNFQNKGLYRLTDSVADAKYTYYIWKKK